MRGLIIVYWVSLMVIFYPKLQNMTCMLIMFVSGHFMRVLIMRVNDGYFFIWNCKIRPICCLLFVRCH